jgi:hypothetical protein
VSSLTPFSVFRHGTGPEDLAKVVLASSPEVSGGRVLFPVTKLRLERNRYESSVWVLLPGPFDIAAEASSIGVVFLSRRSSGRGCRSVG